VVRLLLPLALAADLVVLDAPGEADDAFVQELQLSADVQVLPHPEDFSPDPDTLRTLMGDAPALTWMETEDDAVRAWVAVAEDDRANLQVVQFPAGPGAEMALALAATELARQPLVEASPPPVIESEPEPEPEPPPPPTAPPPAHGPLALASGSWALPGPGFGLGVGYALGSGQALLLAQLGGTRRAGLELRYVPRWVLAGARVDVARIATLTIVQPKLMVGVHGQRGRVGLEGVVAVTPLRDQVLDGSERVYDSGWIEVGIRLRFSRKVEAP